MEKGTGAQILSQGDNIASGVVEIAERLVNLIVSFTHTQNQVGLRDHASLFTLGDHIE